MELIGLILLSRSEHNTLYYNFFTLFEFCFYLFVLSNIIKVKRVKKIILVTLFIFLPVALVNILFIQKETFHSFSYSIGCLLVVTFCIYYFFELFSKPNSIKLVREPAFWICSGLLLYYCCSFPLMGLLNLFYTIRPTQIDNIRIILISLNIILYTLFIIAFLCRIKSRKYTSS